LALVAHLAAWVAQAWREHHAGRLTLDETLAMVRQHRGPEATEDDATPSDTPPRLGVVLPLPLDE